MEVYMRTCMTCNQTMIEEFAPITDNITGISPIKLANGKFIIIKKHGKVKAVVCPK